MHIVRLVLLLSAVSFLQIAHAEVDCAALDKLATDSPGSATASSSGSIIPGYASGREVIGKGRLQFYSAPDRRCKMPGVFIVPGDTADAHLEYGGFTWIVFINLKNGTDVEGWVESSRLRANGTGISPRQ